MRLDTHIDATGSAMVYDPLDIGSYGRRWISEHYEATRKGGREGSLGASNLDSCARKMVHEKIGTRPTVQLTVNGYAFRGETYEERYLVPMVTSWADMHHARLIFAGKDQVRLRKDDLTATPDGLVIEAPYNMLEPYGVLSLNGTCFPVEFKTFDPRISDEKLPKRGHVIQLNAQIGLFRETTNHQPTYGLLIYVNASDPADVRRFVVEFDPDLYDGSKQRARIVMDAVRAKKPMTMRPEGKIDDDGECDECPYDHESTCGGYGFAIPATVKEVAPEVVRKASNIAKALEDEKEKEKSAASGRRQLEATLKELMAQAGTKTITSDDFEVKWSKSPGRKTFDRLAALNKLTEYGHTESEFYKEGSSFDQLRIKRLTSK